MEGEPPIFFSGEPSCTSCFGALTHFCSTPSGSECRALPTSGFASLIPRLSILRPLRGPDGAGLHARGIALRLCAQKRAVLFILSVVFVLSVVSVLFRRATHFCSTPSGSECRALPTSGFASLIPRLSILRPLRGHGAGLHARGVALRLCAQKRAVLSVLFRRATHFCSPPSRSEFWGMLYLRIRFAHPEVKHPSTPSGSRRRDFTRAALLCASAAVIPGAPLAKGSGFW